MRLLTLSGLLLMSGAGALGVHAPAAPVSADARVPVTVPVTLTNAADAPDTDALTLSLPDGWRLLAGETTFRLAPHESHVELLTLLPPSTLPAGDAQVLVRTRDAAATLRFTVAPTRRVRAVTTTAPTFDVRGAYDVQWRVTNGGNVTEALQFAARADVDADVQVTPAAATLRAGETLEVRAHVTPRHVVRLQDAGVRLEVRADGLAPARATATTTLIPTVTPLDQQYHVFPLTLTVGGALGTSGSAADFTLHGRGAPVQGDPGTLDVLATRQGFTVTYVRPEMTWAAGQVTGGAAPLDTVSAVGVKAALHRAALDVEGLAGLTARGEAAAALSATLPFAQGNVQFGVSRVGERTVVGGGGRWAGQADGWAAQLEAGAAVNVTGGGATVRANGRVSVGATEFTGAFARTTPGWRDTPRTTQSAALSVSGKVGDAFTYTVGGAVSGETWQRYNVRAAATLKQPFGTLGAQMQATNTTRSVTGTLTQKAFGWPLTHRVNWTADLGTGATSAQYALSTQVRAGGQLLQPSVGLGLQSGTLTWSAGVNGSAALAPGTLLTYQVASANVARGDVNASVNVTRALSGTQSLAVAGTVARADGRWAAGVRVSTTLSMDVPVHARRDVARVEGRVTDATGAGRANLIVRAGGLAAITDAAGRFVFPAVPAGDVTVTVLSSDGPGDVAFMPALPLTLHVRAGETRTLEVRAVTLARVSGQVTLVVPSEDTLRAGGLMPEVPRLADLVLQLNGADGTVRTVSPNADGTFVFPGVTPGAYTVTFAAATAARLAAHDVTLPAPLTVAAGAQVDAPVRVQLRPRVVRFEDAEDLTPTTP
ncbi:carboxypeptidase-like regulatory domain-containing protein [Deinococcus maricopensis]|uniref:Alpha-amylase n=1 Tax=Deinococcus maricopensis (strain DSM 21211 / LMG 22137 / NRRL B-23946 / LB-34) TaxID=709986 RepID=E8U498_DEIML|nr:carboxypeptidase-like regulatory domain-containing protein [Deinococcus maricopensis]ADV65935.1 hypothetical protein Deima_0272 [Deinococcus maricopensis DSM 21211]